MSDKDSGESGWPWVIKLKADSDRTEIRTAISRASQEGGSIVIKVIKGDIDLRESAAQIARDAIDQDVTVTFEPVPDD